MQITIVRSDRKVHRSYIKWLRLETVCWKATMYSIIETVELLTIRI